LKFSENMTHRKRLSTLAEVADTAVFLASDKASGITGTVANLPGGMIVDWRSQYKKHVMEELGH
jgi:enoyl-[acyl-carrier-protein] reductase (NADH)